MLPQLLPLVEPLKRGWLQSSMLNGVASQPVMHAILLTALPNEMRHLVAASASSPQPCDDLRAAVLARHGESYRPLPGSHHEVSLLLCHSERASIPGSDHPPDEVEPVSCAIDLSAQRRVSSKSSAYGRSHVPAIRTYSPTSNVRDTALTSDSAMDTMSPATESAADVAWPAIRP
ncbi:hypothetical protein HPB52_000533 [Rhipicephalus sanguineus]|uniref:Uncharacterized protein n=1 Tax=Rhipicephalus sanguineus TaxID=34632 RepID=A0A9D4T4U1_RHISA|nr:hypothetical protein HPB52_000533 [Rhipicephalus sanguineus]